MNFRSKVPNNEVCLRLDEVAGNPDNVSKIYFIQVSQDT